MSNQVILVDEQDEELGVMDKMPAHEQGLLHRAFSILIFNGKGEMLIHKRASVKYHSPNLWTNACCSHPNPAESIEETIHKRLKEEMGFDCPLKYLYSFVYRAEFENGLTEYEYDHVYHGIYEGPIQINLEEASDYKYVDLETLHNMIKLQPEDFTYWFKRIIQDYKNYI